MAAIDEIFNAHTANLGPMRASLVDELNEHESAAGSRAVDVEEKIVFKAGDLIYSGEMHLTETEDMLGSIINDFSGILAGSPEEFIRVFGQYLPLEPETN